MVMIALLVVAVALSLPAGAAAKAESKADAKADAPAMALLPVVGSGLSVDELARADKALHKEGEKALGAKLQREGTTRARLDAAAARGVSCDRGALAPGGSLDCFVQSGVVCEADSVIVAEIVRAGAGLARVSLVVVDVREAAIKRSAARTGALGEALIADVFARLAAPGAASSEGVLVIDGAPDGARVLVDGKEAAPPFTKLALGAGPHRVEIVADGDPPIVRDILVDSGETVAVDARRGAAPPAAAVVAPATATSGQTPAALAPIGAPSSPGTPPMMSSSLVLITGVGAAAVGLVAVGVGLAPRIGYALDAAELAAQDQALRADPSALDDARANSLKDTAARAREEASAWSTWGEPVAVVGALVLGAGAGVAVGALLAGSPE